METYQQNVCQEHGHDDGLLPVPGISVQATACAALPDYLEMDMTRVIGMKKRDWRTC